MGRQITRNFNEDELRCRCGCERMEFSDQAVAFLQELRDEFGHPMEINSGYRCPQHNAAVSTTGPNGPHTVTAHDNITVDVAVSGHLAWKLEAAAYRLGWTGKGNSQTGPHGKRFIHLDRIRPGGERIPRPNSWGY